MGLLSFFFCCRCTLTALLSFKFRCSSHRCTLTVSSIRCTLTDPRILLLPLLCHTPALSHGVGNEALTHLFLLFLLLIRCTLTDRLLLVGDPVHSHGSFFLLHRHALTVSLVQISYTGTLSRCRVFSFFGSKPVLTPRLLLLQLAQSRSLLQLQIVSIGMQPIFLYLFVNHGLNHPVWCTCWGQILVNVG